MANIIPFGQRVKTAVRALRGQPFAQRAQRQIISYGEQKKMPLLWPDFRTGIAQWHVIDLANYIQEGFQGNSLIYSAIMYKARAQMQVPLRAYRGDPDAPELLPPNDPLSEICARPNFHQSYPELAMQAMVYFNLAGECFFVFDRPAGGGLPINILCLRPDRMHIVPTRNKKKLLGYVYTPENVPVSDGLRILAQDVMHVKLPNPGDPLEGMGHGLSPIAPMAKSADVDNDITDFLKKFFERGVMLPGILSTEMPLDDATLNRIQERWKEIYGGYEAWAEEIGVMDSSVTYQRIGLNFEEMGFNNLDQRNEARLLGPFGVPPSLIATRLGMAAATENNRATDRKQCWEDTLLPELTLFEREWQYYLQGDNGGWVAYDTSNVVALQEDKAALITAAHQLWTMGFPANMAVGEVGLTMEPIPGGDIGYLPMGLLPVGAPPVARPAPGSSTPMPDAEDEEEHQDTTKKGQSPSAHSGGRSRLTEQVKQALGKKADTIAWSWTPAFTRTAREQFEIDHRELSAAVTSAGKKSIQEKATINWQWMLREWTEIFALAGDRWREAFLPGIEGVMIDQGESLSLEFGVQWNVHNLFAEDWFTDYMGDFSKGIVDTTQDDMNAVLAQGMREGWSIPTTQKHLSQMFETWQGKVPKPGATWDWLEARIPPKRAEMIARTETIRASARGSQGVYSAWGLERKEWLTTEDDRACPWCLAMNKTIIAIDDAYFEKGSVFTAPSLATGKPVSIRLNYEAVQGPPLHVSCVLPGNVVAVPGLVAGIKSHYEGRAVEIMAVGGDRAIVTENHPILTTKGWIPARLIAENEHSVMCADITRIASGIRQDYRQPGRIEDVFASIAAADDTATHSAPVLPSALHGDGVSIQGNTEVVYSPAAQVVEYNPKPSDVATLLAATTHAVVASVRYFDYSGPVYDLHSAFYGLFSCGGIIIQNCRCALMPVLPEEGIEPEAGPEEAVVMEPTAPWQRAAAWSDDPTAAQSTGIGKGHIFDGLPNIDKDNISREQRAEIKKGLVDALVSKTGLPYDKVNDIVGQWARSSNDGDMRSLALQLDAATEFSIPMSNWAAEQANDVIAHLDKVTADLARRGEEPTATVWPKLFPILPPNDQRGLLRTMYEETQTRLVADGVPETVRMYRGVNMPFGTDAELHWADGDTVEISTNTLSSWTTNASTARDFATWINRPRRTRGFVLAMDVPRSRIISTARTGFGCMAEEEFVVLGNAADTAQVVSRH